MSLSKPQFEKDVTIVIPVHNRAELTERCLESIAASRNAATYELIVIDNGSTDTTKELLASVDGDITVITNRANEGFARACNRGAQLASGDYLLFLNNDTEVPDGYLDGLLKCARNTPQLGAVGAKLVYPNGRVQHAGIAVNEDGVPYHVLQNFEASHAAACETRPMRAVTAACLLIETNVFLHIGGFDDGYVNGFEDVDLCFRVSESGLTNVYCGEVSVVHLEESTPGRKAHDRENLARLREKWSRLLVQDDNQYLAKHGLTIEWSATGGKYRTLAVTAQASTPTVEASTLLDLAHKKYLEGLHEEAAEILQRVVSSRMTLGRDDEFETWQLLGNCMARLNRAEDAENAYLNAAASNHASERPFLGLGSVAMLQQNWVAAQYGFLAALSKNPTTMRAEFGLGVSLMGRGKQLQAIQHFARISEVEPDNAEAVLYLYRAAMESGAPHLSIGALSSYLERHPEDAEFWFHLAGAQWKGGSHDEAIDSCKKTLELNPAHQDAQQTLRYMQLSLQTNA